MGINSVNNNYSPVVWNSSNVTGRGEKIDFSNTLKPANADKFVLNLPANETIYQRKEFVTDESMGEDCAFCYTYMERTLAYGTLTVSSSISDGYFVINKDGQTFGKSGADMNNIEHAVEETLECKDRALEQTTLSGSLSGAVTVNGHTVGGALGFAVQNTTYKYSSESVTKGTIAYKNGGAGIYRERAVSSLEIYNKCAVFLAEAFGKKSSDLVLSDSAFYELFGKQDGDEKTFSEIAAQKHKNLDKQLGNLKEFMEKNLAYVRKKDPDCGSLQTFADTYLKLGAYEYSDIASLVEKMFTARNVADTEF